MIPKYKLNLQAYKLDTSNQKDPMFQSEELKIDY